MKKKTVAALLAVAMAVAMTACADKGEETGTTNLADGYEAPEYSNAESTEVSNGIGSQSAADTEGDVSSQTEEEQGSAGESQSDTDEKTEDADEDQGDTDKEQDRLNVNGNEDTDYQIETVRYDSGLDDVKAAYPQISGWDNEEAQEKWNDVFYEAVKDVCKDAGINDSIDIEFEVMTQNDEICSLVMLEHSDWEGAAHPYAYCSTYNIDMKTGEQLTLTDFADPEELADTLLSGENYSIQTDDITLEDILFAFGEMSELPDKERLGQDLASFDLPYEERIKITEDIMLYGSSFLEDGEVVLSIEVNHAMGDYVWIEMQQ